MVDALYLTILLCSAGYAKSIVFGNVQACFLDDTICFVLIDAVFFF